MPATPQNVVARFTFKPEYASDFLFEEEVAAGRYIKEDGDCTLEEAIEFIEQFESSLEDAQILIEGVRVITMSDFLESADEE